MMFAKDPGNSQDTWAVRILFLVLGAIITAVIGFLVSKLRDYEKAKQEHLDELKTLVLEPLRSIFQLSVLPEFHVDWGPHSYKRDADSSELPSQFGPLLSLNLANFYVMGTIEEALLQDASVNHYPELIKSWESFVSSVHEHAAKRRRWIEELAETILETSELEAHPTITRNGPYVMQLALALFVYGRVLRTDHRVLTVQGDGEAEVLSDGGANLAKGKPAQIRHLKQAIDSLIRSNNSRGSDIEREVAKIVGERLKLSRQFSLAITAKRLPKPCDLVRFSYF